MILGIGTDILRCQRIAEVIARQGDRFAERSLTNNELNTYQQHSVHERFLAKRFAAKEAVGKALGTGIGQGVSWHDIEITSNQIGAPEVILSGEALKRAQTLGGDRVMISLSDEKEYVVAFAVLAVGTSEI